MTTRTRRPGPRVPVLLLGCLLAVTSFVSASTSTLRKPAHDAALPTRACDATTMDADAAYCDSTLPMDDRVADLLARLTAEEKVRCVCA